MKNKLIELLTAHRRLILMVLGTLVLAVAVVWGFKTMGSAINEHRITKLETEKQEALKQAQAAHDQNLILQGEVKAKNEQIANLTSQIEDSNQRVTNAHTETVTARTNYDKVRNAGPKFNAADDAGRVVELGADLRGLYPDSP